MRYIGNVNISNAQNAIDHYAKNDVKNWFQKLLDILKEEKYARVQLYTQINWTYTDWDHKEDFTDFVDVENIANTYEYASFFDLFNHSDYINYDFKPIETDKLEYPLTKFYHKYYHISNV